MKQWIPTQSIFCLNECCYKKNHIILCKNKYEKITVNVYMQKYFHDNKSIVL